MIPKDIMQYEPFGEKWLTYAVFSKGSHYLQYEPFGEIRGKTLSFQRHKVHIIPNRFTLFRGEPIEKTYCLSHFSQKVHIVTCLMGHMNLLVRK